MSVKISNITDRGRKRDKVDALGNESEGMTNIAEKDKKMYMSGTVRKERKKD